VRTIDAHQLDVRAVRETRMPLDARAESKQLAALRLAPHDRVGIPHRDRRELHPLVAEVERLGLPHLDASDVELDLSVVAHVALDLEPADAQCHLPGTGLPREPCGDDPCSVSGQLRCRAVGIPDQQLGPRTVDRHDFEQPVGADAVVVVTQTPHTVRCQWVGKLSPLDQQVIVAERLPLRQFHLRPRRAGDRR
jgi:hypothetical protein